MTWVQHLSAKKILIAKNANNILFIAYLLVYFFTRKSCFLVAFFLCVLFADTVISDSFSNSQYYLVMALIYSILYWYLSSKKEKLKTICCCGIMLLFQIIMIADAILFPYVETFVWTNYAFFVVSIHVAIICSLFRWSRIRSSLGRYLRAWLGVFRIDDGVSFLWYNIKKGHYKTKMQ